MPYGLSEIQDENDAQKGGVAPDAAQGMTAPQTNMQHGPSPSAGNQAGQSYADFLHGSGPTQTGFLNFDSFAGANGQASRDSAKRLNESTANAAQKAKQGVYDVNNDYQNALESNGAPDKQRNFKDVESGMPDWMKNQMGSDSHLVGGPGSQSATPPGSNTQSLSGDSTKPGAPKAAPTPAAPAGDKTAPPAGGAPGSGGAAGPVAPGLTPEQWGNANAAAAFPQTSPTMNGNNAGAGEDPYRQVLEKGATTTYNGPTSLSEDPRYQQVGADVRNAQRGLDATKSEAGLTAASGGTYADGALMNQQGQRAFGQTRDAYGNLNKFASDVDANASKQGAQAKHDAEAKAGDYQEQLGKYDTQKSAEAKAAADKAAADKANTPKSFDDMLTGDDEHTLTADESGQRTTWSNTDNVANWHLGDIGPGNSARKAAENFMDQSGVPADQRQQTFEDFMKSLPDGMRNYVNGMIEENSPIVGKVLKGGMAAANSNDDWVWFNKLFNGYLDKKKGK